MKPRKEKRIRVYELYETLGEFTHMSRYYHHGVIVLHIAARSLKQAYHYAEEKQWYTEKSGVGILEQGQGDHPWQRWDWSNSWEQSYFHGKVVK